MKKPRDGLSSLPLILDVDDFKVERLLSAEQKATDYRSPDDGIAPDHRPTNACTRFIQLREDYKSAKLAARLSFLWPSSS